MGGGVEVISSPRLVLSLSSSLDQGSNQPELRASGSIIQSLLYQVSGLNSCQAVQSCLVMQLAAYGFTLQPFLQSPWWFLAETKGSAHSYSPLGQPLRVGLASWSIRVPGCVTISDRQRLFSWATAKQAPGNFPPATCRVAMKLSHRILPPRAKNPLLFFNMYIVVFVDL